MAQRLHLSLSLVSLRSDMLSFNVTKRHFSYFIRIQCSPLKLFAILSLKLSRLYFRTININTYLPILVELSSSK